MINSFVARALSPVINSSTNTSNNNNQTLENQNDEFYIRAIDNQQADYIEQFDGGSIFENIHSANEHKENTKVKSESNKLHNRSNDSDYFFHDVQSQYCTSFTRESLWPI